MDCKYTPNVYTERRSDEDTAMIILFMSSLLPGLSRDAKALELAGRYTEATLIQLRNHHATILSEQCISCSYL
jgi:hypothetical protein